MRHIALLLLITVPLVTAEPVAAARCVAACHPAGHAVTGDHPGAVGGAGYPAPLAHPSVEPGGQPSTSTGKAARVLGRGRNIRTLPAEAPSVRAAVNANPAAVDASTYDSVTANRGMFGINVGTWDYEMLSSSTPATLAHLGVGVQQFPNLETWNWHTDLSRNASDGY